MITKNSFVFLICAAVFILTFFASFAVAQILDKEKPVLSDSYFPTGIAGTWRFNAAESDDVSTKIGELLQNGDIAPTNEDGEDKESEQPAISISLFAPETLILANGDGDEMTINEVFKSVIETRAVLVAGTLREYEIFSGAKIAITATRITDGFTIETVSPRGNKMTETFRLAQEEEGGTKLIVVVRIERFRTREILNLQRVYDRESTDITSVAE